MGNSGRSFKACFSGEQADEKSYVSSHSPRPAPAEGESSRRAYDLSLIRVSRRQSETETKSISWKAPPVETDRFRPILLMAAFRFGLMRELRVSGLDVLGISRETLCR